MLDSEGRSVIDGSGGPAAPADVVGAEGRVVDVTPPKTVSGYDVVDLHGIEDMSAKAVAAVVLSIPFDRWSVGCD